MAEQDMSKRTVLLVDDYTPEREAARRALVGRGVDVESALNFHGAATWLAARVPHIVCLELVLPRESGFELCEHIRADRRLAAVPILVVSYRGSPEDMANAEKVGANAFLKKPFTSEKLLRYVVALLDGPRASRPSVRRLCVPAQPA